MLRNMFVLLGSILLIILLGFFVFNRDGRYLAVGCLIYFFLGIYAILVFYAILSLIFGNRYVDIGTGLFILTPLIIYVIYVKFVKSKN